MTRLIIPLLIIIFLVPADSALAKDEYLSTGELSAVTGGSMGLFWLSHALRGLDTTRTPIISGPILFEESVQRFFGGEARPGKRNFLDDTRGSVITPAAFGIILAANNLGWPQTDRDKDFSQDLFIYLMGLAATKGITHSTKALISRPRPYVTLGPPDRPIRRGFHDDRSSFFSGHTSSAFFSATFVNLRLRATMRSELSGSEYHDWRWAPSTLSYGWATYVGYSRIQAYKHYLSDVLAGAVVGYLLGELFFSFAKETNFGKAGFQNKKIATIQFRF